ncbi:hypothetical protein ACSFA0_23400 [Variovorax sp. LT1P1]|uniref:hypothetical protein n=1 Tax=Variovorax sp. LT1P1 TaxID=3443730 RepID=UPI003F44B02C
MSKIDGQTFMGTREATNAEHAKHVEAGYYVARLKGGSKLHLRKLAEDAVCGAHPTSKGGFRHIKRRDGWETYKQDGHPRASCLQCLDGFRPVAPPPASWPFPLSQPAATEGHIGSLEPRGLDAQPGAVAAKGDGVA